MAMRSGSGSGSGLGSGRDRGSPSGIGNGYGDSSPGWESASDGESSMVPPGNQLNCPAPSDIDRRAPASEALPIVPFLGTTPFYPSPVTFSWPANGGIDPRP